MNKKYIGWSEDGLTIIDHIIAILFSARSTRIRKQILWELLQERRKTSRSVFNQAQYRMAKRGIISAEGEFYSLLKKPHRIGPSPFRAIQQLPKNSKKIMIIFDIPEPKKKIREWLRNQLKLWNFIMIQKSVWTGNGPLPKEFRERLKLFEVSDGVKIFTVQKSLE